MDNCDEGGEPFRERTHDDYDNACEACEVWVKLPNVGVFRSLRGKLFLDKRKGTRSCMGRCLLTGGFEPLGLEKGDRLEPHAGMINHSQFDEIQLDFPAGGTDVLFWRRRNETIVRHRNPIFSTAIGVVTKVLSIDALHTLNLGVNQNYCMCFFCFKEC